MMRDGSDADFDAALVMEMDKIDGLSSARPSLPLRPSTAAAGRQLTSSQRRVLADVEDHIGALYDWPHLWSSSSCSTPSPASARRQTSRRERFRHMLFLLGNLAPPRPAAALMDASGMGRV